MNLSLNSAALYGPAPARPQPVDAGAERLRQVPASQTPPRKIDVGEARQTQRSEDYVAALRELKAQTQEETRRSQASRTYLDIAHFEGNFQLINVYA